MPRRRPAQVRAGYALRPGELDSVPGLSRAATGAVVRLGRRDLRPICVARALADWAGAPQRSGFGGGRVSPTGGDLPFFGVPAGRALLEQAVRALPAAPARELRRVVAPLDERFLTATLPDPTAPQDLPWWARRVYR